MSKELLLGAEEVETHQAGLNEGGGGGGGGGGFQGLAFDVPGAGLARLAPIRSR